MSNPADAPSGSEADVFETLIRQFEQEWRHGPRPDVAAFLPAAGGRRVKLLVELAHIDLEFRLASGEPARAADYLARFPELRDHPTAAGELILTEYRLLERAGRAVQPTAFLNGYPDHRTALMDGLSDAGRTRTPGPRPVELPVFTPTIDGLEVGRELGRGGMGVVFLAYQPGLNRHVAVKTLRAGPAATAAERARFQREAEAIARLDHPHIVPIYKVGEWSLPGSAVPVPYFVMKFYPGGSLEAPAVVSGTFAAAAGRVETVARAVDHAHRRGVLHRDLKPSNILLDDAGQPHVADLGLASVYDADSSAAATGTVVGTPAYMAPEQATAPGQVTVAADVYGVGAVLYQLLTGRPPFHGDNPLATLHRVTTDPPERPRAVRPTVPRDLETICLKCLEKEPGKRYATAAALADDLRAYLDGRPIAARPATAVEVLWRAARRNPVGSALAAVAAAAVVVAVTILAVSYVRIRDKEEATQEALTDQLIARADLTAALDRERVRLAVERVASAARFWQANQVPQARQMLDECPPRLRRWEWFHLDAVLRDGPLRLVGHNHTVRAAAFLGDATLATADSSGFVRIWPLTDPTAVVKWPVDYTVSGLAADPNGTWLAVAGADTVTVWDVAARKRTHTLDGKNWVTVSPDGKHLAAGNGETVRVWDCRTWGRTWELTGHTQAVSGGSFSPDGGRLATCAADRTTRVWDLTTGRLADTWPRVAPVWAVAFTRGGRVVESYSGVLAVVDPTTGEADRRVEHGIGRPVLAVGGDDRVALSTPAGEVVVRPLADPRAVPRHLRGHTGVVSAVAISRDGTRLASAGQDMLVRVWDLTPNPAERDLARLTEPVGGVAVSPDGRLVAVAAAYAAPASEALTVRVFDAEGGKVLHTLPGREAVAFAPDSAHLYTVGKDGGAMLYRVADGTPVRGWRVAGGFAHRLALSPDGATLAVGTTGGAVTLIATGSEVVPPPVLTEIGTVEGLAFHPTENRLAVSARARTLVWDLTRNAAEFGIPGAKGARAVAFDPNGRWLAALDTDRTVRRYDANTGEEINVMAGSVSRILGMAIHPDASRLATYSADGAVKIWDIPSGRDVLTFPGTEYPFGAVAWDAAGQRLFAADTALRVRSGATTPPASAR